MTTPDLILDPPGDNGAGPFLLQRLMLPRILLAAGCVLLGALGHGLVTGSISSEAPQLLATAGHDVAPPMDRVGHPQSVAVHNLGAQPLRVLAAQVTGTGLRQLATDLPTVPVAAGGTALVQVELGGCRRSTGRPAMTVWTRSADGAVSRSRLDLSDLEPGLAALRDRVCRH
jgi:hypothetical protein